MAPKKLKRTKTSQTTEPTATAEPKKRQTRAQMLAEKEDELQYTISNAQETQENRPRGKGKGMALPQPSVPEPKPGKSAQEKKEARKIAQNKQTKAIVQKETRQDKKTRRLVQENLKRKQKAEMKKTTKKNPNAPKAPTGGAYGVFLKENREDIKKDLSSNDSATLSIAAITKEAGTRWKALGEAEKQVYMDQYAAKAAAYKKELDEFKKGGGQTRIADPKVAGMKLRKNPLAPKVPAGGGYGVFLEEHRQEITKGLGPYRRAGPAVTKEAGKQWKALGSPDRRAYKEKFAAKSAAYKKELEDFKASGGQTKVVDMKVKRQRKSPGESAEEKRKREDDAARAAVDRMRAARSALVGA